MAWECECNYTNNWHIMKSKYILLLLSVIILSFASCEKNSGEDKKESVHVADAQETVTLEFSFTVNKKVYLKTNFGEAPQVAIWLEYPDSDYYKTVWVTRRAGNNDWDGKVECKVALPFWDSRRKNEKTKNFFERIIDAVTGATIKEGKLQTTANVLPDKILRYYIEVNVSGDYSEHYPYWSDSGIPDTEGNGQPSIVYSGLIDLKKKGIEQPLLIGHTNQFSAGPHLYNTTESITTAKDLLDNLWIHRIEK